MSDLREKITPEVIRGMVKPLVFYHPFSRKDGESIASCFVSGLYYSVDRCEGKWKLKVRGSHTICGMGLWPTPEEAKAAANEHHKAAIMAALKETDT